jgi:hypothetical protein
MPNKAMRRRQDIISCSFENCHRMVHVNSSLVMHDVRRFSDILTNLKGERMKLSKSAKSLSDAINKAIEDHELTNAEYDEIMHIAHEDGIIDPEERALLSQLQEMIADKTIRRVGR